MVEFFENTWLVRWIFAALIILRWFYLISNDPGGKSAKEREDREDLIEAVAIQQGISYRARLGIQSGRNG